MVFCFDCGEIYQILTANNTYYVIKKINKFIIRNIF